MFGFKRLREDYLELVMRWRVQPAVAKNMYTEFCFDMKAQRRWFQEEVSRKPTAFYWVIFFSNRPIGVINLASLDLHNKRTSYGYYIGELDCWNLGGLVPPYLFNHIFSKPGLNLHKITAEVLSGNANVLKMHRLYGFREVGIFRDHIFKNGRFYDVVQSELLKADWTKMAKKFGHYLAKFE